MSAPRVSVILPAYESGATIGPALDALDAQSFGDFETIVVDSSPGDATERLVTESHPDVVFRHSRERLLPHAARNRGAAIARGEVLVFSDPDCVARPDWLERLLAAHERGHAVVGGAIELGQHGWVTSGIHLSKFEAWMAGGPPGTRNDLATANVLWSRAAMDEVGRFQENSWCGDTEASWQAREAGIELYFEPGAVVTHTHEVGLRRAWMERLTRGEDFARMRIRVKGFSKARAALHLLAVPIVPVVMQARALRHARRSGRLGRAVLSTPIQLLAYLGWSIGEGRAFARALSAPHPH